MDEKLRDLLVLKCEILKPNYEAKASENNEGQRKNSTMSEFHENFQNIIYDFGLKKMARSNEDRSFFTNMIFEYWPIHGREQRNN